MKCWCVWCEQGEGVSKSGYYWIHPKCADELMDISGDLKSVKEMLQGIHRRNKQDDNKFSVICKFIADMEDFKRRWDNTIKKIKEYREGEKK